MSDSDMVHAEEPGVFVSTSRMAWTDAPNEGEQVFIDKDLADPVPTRISPDYRRLQCAGCNHIFWAWLRNVVDDGTMCPKCKFPLKVDYEAIVTYRKIEDHSVDKD